MPDFGLIGGSGIYDIPGMKRIKSVKLQTPYGDPSDVFRIGTIHGKEIVFLPRHGAVHNIPPQRINYRANIWGFRELGVRSLISIAATGGINRDMKPGAIVVLDQVIDMTSGRDSTFFDASDVVHIDFTEPFCPSLRAHFLAASEKAGFGIHSKGTYIAVNGPRLETAAEIRVYDRLGADVIGMTGMPEASLAREAELCYCAIAVVANAAAGICESRLSALEVATNMKASTEAIQRLLKTFLQTEMPSDLSCSCRRSLQDARMKG